MPRATPSAAAPVYYPFLAEFDSVAPAPTDFRFDHREQRVDASHRSSRRVMRGRALRSMIAAAGLWLLSAASASAVTLDVVANGLTALASNYTCDGRSASIPRPRSLISGPAGYGNIGGHDYVNTFNVLVTPVPEPMAGLLVLVGLAGLARRVRRG